MEISILDLFPQNKGNIIDIRDNQKYKEGHIPGAVSVEAYELLFHPDKYIQKGKTYYLYCDSGMKSRRISRELNMKGYSTVNIQGGYHNYLLMK
ncbi:MAG: rhodanese-like domain-containing protein [Bacilli bacterium]|nr:rhodanese-like domain-containing protein [Bacilli bacterium]